MPIFGPSIHQSILIYNTTKIKPCKRKKLALIYIESSMQENTGFNPFHSTKQLDNALFMTRSNAPFFIRQSELRIQKSILKIQKMLRYNKCNTYI